MVCEYCNGSGRAVSYKEIGRDELTVTVERRIGVCPHCNGTGVRPMTNGDRYRSMSNEELAVEFTENGWGCRKCSEWDRLGGVTGVGNCDKKCAEHCLEMLKQPAKEAK